MPIISDLPFNGSVTTVVDSLESTSVTNALSANKGRELNEKIATCVKMDELDKISTDEITQ